MRINAEVFFMNISKKAIKRTGVPAVRRGASLPVSAYENDDAPLLACVLKNSLLGLAATAISGLILISATCALAYSSADPSSLIAPLSLLALLPSNFLGGFVTAKKTHRSPLACGLVCGAVTTLVMILFSLLLLFAHQHPCQGHFHQEQLLRFFFPYLSPLKIIK